MRSVFFCLLRKFLNKTPNIIINNNLMSRVVLALSVSLPDRGKKINLSEPRFPCKYFLTPKYLRVGGSRHPFLLSSQLPSVQKLSCIVARSLPVVW